MKTIEIKLSGQLLGTEETILYASYLNIDNDKAIHFFSENLEQNNLYTNYAKCSIIHPYICAGSPEENLSQYITMFKSELLKQKLCVENESGVLFVNK